MPARSRPTARLLTPSGWVGLAVVAALAAAAIFVFVFAQSHLA